MNTGYLSLDEAVKLHGHKGPWLVLGYRLGVLAREVLHPLTYHGLRCVVYLPLRKPYTCLLDGLQASSGCTIGKLNLEYKGCEGFIRIVFENTETTGRLELVIDRESIGYINGLIERHGVEGAADIVEREDLWRLVRILT